MIVYELTDSDYLNKFEINNSGTEKLMSRTKFKLNFMKFLVKTLTVVVLITILTNCASIVSRSNWPVSVSTNPSGAKVVITDKNGLVVYTGNTPATMKLRSGAGFFTKQSYKVKITMDGFADKIIPIECSLNGGWYILGNIVFGGLIGWLIVDPATGAMYRIDNRTINETLAKSTSSIEPALRIININDLPAGMKGHLVAIK